MRKRIFAIVMCFTMIFGTFSVVAQTNVYGDNINAATGSEENTSGTSANGTDNTAVASSGSQIGDKIWIKSGSYVYKTQTEENGYKINENCEIEIVNIATDDNGNAVWYKFEFTSSEISEWWISDLLGYKYVLAVDTSIDEPTTPTTPEEPGGETGDKDTTKKAEVNETTITATGDFSNASKVKMTVEEVKAGNYSQDFKDFLDTDKKVSKSDIKFAFDISFADEDNAEWQPADGKNVSVTIDAASMGIKDGDVIGIIHEHDGKIEKQPIAHTVKDGKITFQTDSFSIFYGYTVDFEYDGTWYSIAGGSDIFLYELFAQIGIDESMADVTDVQVSDETLLRISKQVVNGYTGEKDWHIQSLKPFNTEETLTVTMKDSTQHEIKVYDATYSGTLSGNMNLNNGDVINGTSVNGTANLKLNGTVTVNGTINVPQGAVLNITGAGTLKRGDSFTSKMFDVQPGGTLNIKCSQTKDTDVIIIDGGAKWTSTQVKDSTRKTLSVESGPKATSAAIYVNTDNINETAAGKGGVINLENVTFQNLYTEAKVGKTSTQAPAIHTTGSKATLTKTGDNEKLYADNYYAKIEMNKVTVVNCATKSDNAILLFNDSFAKMKECEISNNYSGNRYAGTIKAGGPTYFSQLIMDNCKASENYSSGWGGVVLWAANSECLNGEISKATIKECTFNNNTARYLGGALSNEAIMEVSGTEITNNTAMAGGGIATFPFTRVEQDNISTKNANACGLILSESKSAIKKDNVVKGNYAVATGEFTPFKLYEADATVNNPDADDCDVLQTPIKYTGGGGGLWCYMNKPKWSFNLDVGSGNDFSQNVSKNKGGGIYVDNVTSTSTSLNVTGANISDNKAVDGGGIAVTNEAVNSTSDDNGTDDKGVNINVSAGKISNNNATGNGGGVYLERKNNDKGKACNLNFTNGSISNNTASNGGGIYAINGASVVMQGDKESNNGALLVGNNATGTPDIITTAYGLDLDKLKGVGGGVFIANGGKFKLTGDSIGIYSNLADFAADDVFANGKNTKLDVPNVEDMNLTGLKGTKPSGWFEDYVNSDTSYSVGLNGKTNDQPIKRYRSSSVKEIVKVTVEKANNQNKYVCMTLGLKHGDLTIRKAAGKDTSIDENEYFIFKIENADSSTQALNMTVTVQGTGSTTIHDLPYGVYKITEVTDWSWRYDKQKYGPGSDKDVSNVMAYDETGKTPYAEATINNTNADVTVKVTNSEKIPYWLTDQVDVKNIFNVKNINQ